MKVPIRRSKGCLLGLLMLSSLEGLASNYEQANDYWQSEDYKNAIDVLRIVRNEPFGKRVDVDWMLATSLCRYRDFHGLGRKYLTRMLRVYSLSDENVAIIIRELQNCPAQARPQFVAFNSGRAMAGVSGKSFYFLDDTNEAIGGNPLKVLNPIPQNEISHRLVDFDQGVIAEIRLEHRLREIGYQPKTAVVGRFVIASIGNHSTSEMQEIGRLLDDALNFMEAQFEFTLPQKLFTVYLVPDGARLKDIGNKLHGLIVNRAAIGYSFRDDLSLAAVVRGARVGTLKHELAHLLVRTNFGDIPPWLDEGLAALYEVSRQEESFLRGLPNWRGQVLERYRRDYPVDLISLMTMDWKAFDASNGSMREQATYHALARYWVMYLQEHDLLVDVYKGFRDFELKNQFGDYNAEIRQLFQQVTGKALVELESDFYGWFEHAKLPITKEQIEEVQRRLAALGYDPGIIDGFDGVNTRNAIMAFQQDNNIQADGVIDVSLIDLLFAQTGK